MSLPFKLENHEVATPLWEKLRLHLEARLAALHARNEGSLPIERTNKLRGQIAELRYLLSLATPNPRPAPEDDLFRD